MEYARFTPIPKTDEELIEEQANHKTRQDNIQKIVDDNNLIKLECDYFGIDSYYVGTFDHYMHLQAKMKKVRFITNEIIEMNEIMIDNSYKIYKVI